MTPDRIGPPSMYGEGPGWGIFLIVVLTLVGFKGEGLGGLLALSFLIYSRVSKVW